MSDKAKLLREADDEFSALRQAVEGMAEAEMLLVWLGTWSLREILIHISGWHREMAPAFLRIAHGEEPFPAGTYDDSDAWNARFVEQKTGVKVADVRAELHESQRDFVRAATAVPEEHFEPGGAVRDLFVGAGPGHYREHAAQIREWRAAATR